MFHFVVIGIRRCLASRKEAKRRLQNKLLPCQCAVLSDCFITYAVGRSAIVNGVTEDRAEPVRIEFAQYPVKCF